MNIEAAVKEMNVDFYTTQTECTAAVGTRCDNEVTAVTTNNL